MLGGEIIRLHQKTASGTIDCIKHEYSLNIAVTNKDLDVMIKIGYQLKLGQSACVDVTVGWTNGSIVNPTLMPSSVGCEKHETQPTPLLVPS